MPLETGAIFMLAIRLGLMQHRPGDAQGGVSRVLQQHQRPFNAFHIAGGIIIHKKTMGIIARVFQFHQATGKATGAAQIAVGNNANTGRRHIFREDKIVAVIHHGQTNLRAIFR